jgi:hypothetical protein
LSSLPPRRPRPGLGSTAPPPPEFVPLARARNPWPARQGRAPPGLFKPAAAPGIPNSCPGRQACKPPQNPSRRRFRFPPPAPPRRQGAHPGTRKEVRNPSASRVVVFVHRSNRGTSPEFVACAAATTRRSAASSPRPLSPLASRAHALRVGAARASNRAPEP